MKTANPIKRLYCWIFGHIDGYGTGLDKAVEEWCGEIHCPRCKAWGPRA